VALPRRRRILLALAGAGAVALASVAALVYLDYRSFDRTSGGYDPPYADWTGTPIDWENEAEATADGFRRSGRIVTTTLDCTTGMISFEIAGVRRDFRPVSPRAIAVHRPREACRARGFEPEF
jgi:hypothetical protein